MCVHVNKTKMGRYVHRYLAFDDLMTSLGRYWLGIRKILNHDFGKRARFHLKNRPYVLML